MIALAPKTAVIRAWLTGQAHRNGCGRLYMIVHEQFVKIGRSTDVLSRVGSQMKGALGVYIGPLSRSFVEKEHWLHRVARGPHGASEKYHRNPAFEAVMIRWLETYSYQAEREIRATSPVPMIVVRTRPVVKTLVISPILHAKLHRRAVRDGMSIGAVADALIKTGFKHTP